MSEEKEKPDVGQPLPVTRPAVDHGPKAGAPVDLAEEDITPITREKIKQVNSTQWDGLNIAQLYEQLNTLENRLTYARSIAHQDMIKQLNKGIAQLRLLINQKTDDEIKLI